MNNQTSKREVVQEKGNSDANKTDAARSMIDALTTAPDRPYSPLPTASVPISNIGRTIPVNDIVPKTFQQSEDNTAEESTEHKYTTKINHSQLPQQPSPMFLQAQKRGIIPIPLIKTYNPPEKVPPPIPMPEQTKPYIPPDFKIIIEPKIPRNATASPLVDA